MSAARGCAGQRRVKRDGVKVLEVANHQALFESPRAFPGERLRAREAVKLHCGGRSVEVAALVDTGDTTLVLPRRVAEELGVKLLGRMVAELADGTVREVDYGAVEVEVSDRRAPVLAAIVEGGEVCLGVEALEWLGLAVDPTTGKIHPTRRFVT
ncbi:MAG: aspartyl protease family protein [Thermofilaceae archaeon]